MLIKSKGKGKSGGARVISLNVLEQPDNRIILLDIYDKSERATIKSHDILKLLNELKMF